MGFPAVRPTSAKVLANLNSIIGLSTFTLNKTEFMGELFIYMKLGKDEFKYKQMCSYDPVCAEGSEGKQLRSNGRTENCLQR